MKEDADNTSLTTHDLAEHEVTQDVGSEGGTPGDLERRTEREIGTGAEAGETWRPAERDERYLPRDETGRRNP